MILGAEFLWRFHYQKPLRKFTAVATTEENESLNGDEKEKTRRGATSERGVMTHKEFLMINGLLAATILVLIRCVAPLHDALMRYPPGWCQRSHSL
jgi:hypothetical protein